MSSSRSTQQAFYRVFAEVACAPIASEESFHFAVDDLHQEIATNRPSPFWEAIEQQLISSFQGTSASELSAIRDWIWLPERRLEKASKLIGAKEYLARLAQQLLDDQGFELRPRIDSQHPLREVSSQNRQRLARELISWIGRTIPPDLLAAAYPLGSPLAKGQRLNATSVATARLLEHGFAETHLHLGASFTFAQLWPCVLNLIGSKRLNYDEFKSRNSSFDHGRGLVTWLLRAATLRVYLARFLFLRNSAKDFQEFMKREFQKFRNRPSRLSCGYQDASLALKHTMERLIRPHAFPAETYSNPRLRLLQSLYSHARLNSAQEIMDLKTLSAADPIHPIVAGARLQLGSEQAEQVFLRQCWNYMQSQGAPDKLFRTVFWQVQRVRCLFYRHLTQQQSVPGLVWFTRFYRRISPARRGKLATSAKLCAAAETSGFGKGLQSLEVRVGPESKYPDVLAEIREVAETALAIETALGNHHLGVPDSLATLDIRQTIALQRAATARSNRFHAQLLGGRRSSNLSRSNQVRPRLEIGLVIHFVKEREIGSQEFLSAFEHSSHENPKNSKLPYRYRNYFLGLENKAKAVVQVLDKFPLALQWIRGIDICNDEQAMPNWLFAKPFRDIQDASVRASNFLAKHLGLHIPPVRPTAHAGEDFAHLLTGLRRIDESIDWLGIEEGCRIGHALALGTDPESWCARTGPVAMDKLTRLHDLVWEYSVMNLLSAELTSARAHFVEIQTQRLINELFQHWEDRGNQARERGSELQRRIFKFNQRPSLEDLVQLRKNLADPEMLKAVGYPDQSPGKAVERPQFKYRLSRQKQILLQYLTDEELFRRGRDVILVKTHDAAQTLKALQDHLRRKMAEYGILVEMNPSSNEVVAALTNLSEHPIWRVSRPLYDEQVPEVGVCIGSDDPLVFATSLVHEYQRVADALADQGYAERDVQDWLNRARENSLRTRSTRSTVCNLPIHTLLKIRKA